MIKTYAPPSLETARDQIGTLMSRFGEVTGIPPSIVGKIARGEPKFARTYREIDFGFGSFDIVNSRLSALWPDDAEWPDGIPRQAPADLPADLVAEVRERIERHRASAKPDDWPDDIPRPPSSPETSAVNPNG